MSTTENLRLGYIELEELYKKMENFIADCTREEVDEHRTAINEVLTMIHQRMRGSQKNTYHYRRHMGLYKVWNDYTGEKVFEHWDEEVVRNETYRLNGWKYKPKK